MIQGITVVLAEADLLGTSRLAHNPVEFLVSKPDSARGVNDLEADIQPGNHVLHRAAILLDGVEGIGDLQQILERFAQLSHQVRDFGGADYAVSAAGQCFAAGWGDPRNEFHKG